MGRSVVAWSLVGAQLVLIAGAVAMPGPRIVDAPDPAAVLLRIVGVVAIGAAILPLIGLGRALTASPVPREDGALVTTGCYGQVRHPVYVLLLIGTGALALADGGAGRLACTVALAALLMGKTRWEESLLRQRFPDYSAYQDRVGRFVPRLHRGDARR
jgi:protein-S-isoprenylcysteine O-methyltransferase Ste14